MPLTNETPAGSRAGASSDSFGGPSLESSNLSSQRAQMLIRIYAIRPDLAVLLAGIIFEGGAQ